MTHFKPGTRCECREHHGVNPAPIGERGGTYEHGITWDERERSLESVWPATNGCPRNAVRLVTVRLNPTADQEAEVMRAGGEVAYSEQVPMCEPCAEYHEGRSK